ncbi:hypothetical protein AUJ65_03425 [Candidatus Micrarchaeota archaeon CG1_02_51_15]|nr:MAG: hypothetical protein AUJ65_03425 [Candidatus Micrarchaeota archaeon CG1_02_51_15]
MISGEELRRLAKANGLLPHQQEKHYMQTAVLYAIYSRIADELVFKGGTALFFFYGLGRFSEDLDFTATAKVDYSQLANSITSTLGVLGIRNEVKEKKPLAGRNIKIKAEGPLYRGGLSQAIVDMDVSERNDVVLKPEVKEVVPIYDDLRPFSVPVMNREEIAAEKIRAILKRVKARDLYDLAFLIKKGVNLDSGLVNEKMRFYGEQFDKLTFANKVAGLESVWVPELTGLMKTVPPFKEVADPVLKATAEL